MSIPIWWNRFVQIQILNITHGELELIYIFNYVESSFLSFSFESHGFFL